MRQDCKKIGDTNWEGIFKGDVVFAPQRQQLFVPLAFVEVTLMSGECTFMVQANCHDHKEGALFEGSSMQTLLMWESAFRSVHYIARSSGPLRACLRNEDVLAMSQTKACRKLIRPA